MLEIIALIYLWRINGANAYSRGKSRRRYQFLTLVLWFGFEFIGVMIGTAIYLYAFPEQNYIYGAYMMGIPGAVFGGFLSYIAARKGPIVNPEQSNRENSSFQWNSSPGSYTFSETNADIGAEMLDIPATIRIVEELGGYGGVQDYFYLNGQPVCALYPGMEAVLKTKFVRNVITIGTPDCDKSDMLHSVRFLAANNGAIEIHASAGEILPGLFKNYVSD